MFSTGNRSKWFAWILLLAGGSGLSFYYFFNPGNSGLFPKCPLYVWTGLYCPGCGSQRAIHSLLHFRLLQAMHYNLLFFPAVLFILYHLAIPVIKKVTGKELPNLLYHPRTPWIILAVVILFWILRNIRIAPFDWLAPV
jgi:hypothetical protein